ncbi:cytochrome bd-type quinol oxidase subunit 1 [Pedobacter sp. CG_S7]
MFKYLIVFVLLGLMLIFIGNYLDLRQQKINKKEYDRRSRFFIVLVFILIAIVVYFKKK